MFFCEKHCSYHVSTTHQIDAIGWKKSQLLTARMKALQLPAEELWGDDHQNKHIFPLQYVK